MKTIEYNINRLNHVMSLYGVSKGELLARLNAKRTKELTESDVFSEEIKLSILKKIDELFLKGLPYYIDPKAPTQSKEESIFFRKSNFNATLSLGAKQIVTKFEEEKIAFSTLAKLSDFKIRRQLPVYKITDKPENVASEVRPLLHPGFKPRKKDFLKDLIGQLADYNILVFEFVESPNKKDKANIDGLYLAPNVIVLKRNQKSFSSEIFTLAHELGHYLLNEEEIDENITEENLGHNNLNAIERWCNDFAYAFLIGDFSSEVDSLGIANGQNDYHHEIIRDISKKTHLSRIALYTRLLLKGKISPFDYRQVKDEIVIEIQKWEEEEKAKQALEKQKALEEGRKLIISHPKPIVSPLYLHTLQGALYNNLINEADFCKKLNIKPEKIDQYLT